LKFYIVQITNAGAGAGVGARVVASPFEKGGLRGI
jgi:hypothetical protein